MTTSLRQRIICICIIIATFVVLVGTVIASGLSVQYDVAEGEVCPEDIYATRSIVDTVTTEERKEAAAENVKNVYTTDFSAVDTAVLMVNGALSSIREIRESRTAAEDSPLTILNITPKNNTYIPAELFNAALNLTDSEFDILAEFTPQLLQRVMTEGVTDKSLGLKSFNSAFEELNISNKKVSAIASSLCEGAITVNKTFNADETEKQREVAKSAVSNVTYMKNQIIARRGEIITKAQFVMLSELGFVKGKNSIDVFHTVSVVSLLVLVMALAVVYYLLSGRHEISSSPVITTLICSLLIIAGSFIVLFATRGSTALMCLMPLSLIPALIALLLSANLSCMVNIVIAVLVGIQLNDLSVAISLVLAGTATAHVFSRVRRRAHLLSATCISALCYAATYSAILIDTSKSIIDVFAIFVYALLGGFFGGILTIGTIPFWEACFDVITPMKLGELSNPEHKLLKKLLLKAPGSYHHSLTVANMADAAAECINANPILARVGAYYHDIGKMENPLLFKENQFGIENPHDDLSPTESAEIILKHVTNGAQLASQYRLPSIVKDIILQHHGTTTVSYFLYKARQENPDVDPALFTYPGPTPQSKEATIIMLADACEAAVRAMREKGYVDVKKVVNDIVSARISEGQLAASQLTFDDLEKVKGSFVTTLEQYFHKRILYPQNTTSKE